MENAARDLHVLKYFSSVITVSGGKVINVTEPGVRSCPLASCLYPEIRNADPEDTGSLKQALRKVIESKIRDYGFFTVRRSFDFPARAVPYGASEMLSSGLRAGFIHASVTACDGAGTVITASPEMVQGIGARMNTLIFTSPIRQVLEHLEKTGCHVVSRDNAWIDPVKGIEKALTLGFRKVGVTVPGFGAEKIEALRFLEKKWNATLLILAVCTNGVTPEKLNAIRLGADLAWSCSSSEAREQLGPSAKLTLSKKIPVFALTQRGADFAACHDPGPFPLGGPAGKNAPSQSENSRESAGCFKTFRARCRQPAPSVNPGRTERSMI